MNIENGENDKMNLQSVGGSSSPLQHVGFIRCFEVGLNNKKKIPPSYSNRNKSQNFNKHANRIISML